MLRSSITIARVRGIDIGVNWSWFAIVALIVWSLAAGVFPSISPNLSDATYIGMAVVATLLFFTSLVLHELGHAMQALREGMQIEGITLWIFGGVAKFTGMFPSALAEFRVAVAGPLVTLVIGTLMLGLSAIPGLPGFVSGVVEWLALVNIALLVFNMLPAFPMDGGRVLRSLIWRANDDFTRATAVAGGIGRAFGQFFIVGGLFVFFFTGTFGGAWLALIGWFVINAGQAEVRFARLRDVLGGKTVADLMVRAPATVAPELPVAGFLGDVLPVSRFRAYPVVERGRLLGLLSSRNAAALPRRTWDAATVRDVMVPLDLALVIEADRDLGDAALELFQTEPGRALVPDGHGGLAGLLSITDVGRALELPGAAPSAQWR
jgi:Zn-dependent protease